MSEKLSRKCEYSLNADAIFPSALVAGVDEAGRGPLAGPVVAAAVILDPARPIEGLGDSKALSEARRDVLAAEIRARAWVGIGIAEPAEIDRLNILHATMAAMCRAVKHLPVRPAYALIDGNRLPDGLPCPGEAVIKGDAREPVIGAASIIAKTVRDQLMREAAARFPGYGLEAHKGYPSPAHRTCLVDLGPSPIHRRSYAPVRQAHALRSGPGAAGCG